jgi:hypothetical protein
MTIKTKQCPKCKIEKPEEAFDLTPLKQRKRVCRDCTILRVPLPATVQEKIAKTPHLPLKIEGDPALPAKERLRLAAEERMAQYQCDALDALHDLAVMEIGENSMMAQVKYLAACKLAGNLTGSQERGFRSDPEISATLRELNELYHKHARRVKAIREREINFEDGETIVTQH